MNLDRNYGEDQFNDDESDPMESLWDQHPAPWTADDNRTGNEGNLIVFDASDSVVMHIGDMEDITAGDMRLGDILSAVPEMYELTTLVAADFEDAADWKDAIGRLQSKARAALAKARGE